MESTCTRCGKTFTAKRSTARYCTPACRQATYAARPVKSNDDGRTCALCGGHISRYRRADAQYCGEYCRAAAARERREDRDFDMLGELMIARIAEANGQPIDWQEWVAELRSDGG